MSVRKHNQLSSTFSEAVFSIINEGSVVKVKNSDCTDISVSINLTNGFTNFLNTGFTYNNTQPSGQIAVENSRYYTNQEQIEDADFNTDIFYSLYVQSGSIYNYPFELEQATINLIENNSYFPRSELFIPAISLTNSNTKYEYSLNNTVEVIGTGNQYYSTHFLTNGKYGYWGNAYAGEFTADACGDKKIIIPSVENFSNVLNTIPRNLNGYTIQLGFGDDNTSTLNRPIQINNFYNGILKININKIANSITANDNNCILELNIKEIDNNGNVTYNLNDNQDIALNINKINGVQCSIIGNNNKLKLNINTFEQGTRIYIFSDENSYGNKTYLNQYTEVIFPTLRTNIRQCGNWFYVQGITTKIGQLVNDTDLAVDQSKFCKQTINEVHPKRYRDCCDIGSIIGWPTNLPIPRGYYDCSLPTTIDRTFAVDIRNHKDEFYNGMLAYYLNSKLSQTTFTIPYIPISYPTTGYSSDPWICMGTSCTPIQKTIGLKYIIKYNNNFENVIPDSNQLDPEPEPVPEVIPTTVNVNFDLNPETETSIQEGGNYWGSVWENDIEYTTPGGYITAETSGAEKVYVNGTITWTINRVEADYRQGKNGYYQLRGLKACLWSHQTTDIWSAQEYLYLDFTKAIINMKKDEKTGEVKDIIFHHTRHHNDGDGGGGSTAHWQADAALNTLNFRLDDTNEQIILDKYALIEPNTVCCWNKFTITVTQKTIVFKAWGQAWLQDDNNGNRSWFQFWQSPLDKIGAEFIIPPNG